jgi:diguanylate cyclase (GGDEF)-like protein/PAS domain S-box-containing protein
VRVQLLEPNGAVCDRLLVLLRQCGHDAVSAHDYDSSLRLLDDVEAALILVNLDQAQFRGPDLVRRARVGAQGNSPLVAGLACTAADIGETFADLDLDDLILVDMADAIVAARFGFLERRVSERQRLFAGQAYARIALDSARMASWRYDIASGLILWTAETAAIFGLPEVETRISALDVVRMIHPDDRHFFEEEDIAAFIARGRVDIEFRTIWADGSVHWLEVKGQPSFDQNGMPEMLAGVVFEITGRKEIEENLHTERAMLDILMNHGPDAVYIKDRESRFVRVNATVSKHFGFSDTVELAGKTDFDLFPDEEARRYFADEQRVMETGVMVRNRLDRHALANGGEMWNLTSLAPIRNERDAIVGVIGTSRDVTHYSLDDRQLAIAEMRYRLVVEQIPAITCLYSIKNGVHGYEYISPQVTEMLGYTPREYAELWAKEPAAVFHPDDLDRMIAEVERINAAHAPATVEYRHRMKSGGWKWVRELASPIPGDDPSHRRWQGIIFDLTEDHALTERLEHQVFHDPLTGLPNRLMLSQRLDQAVARSDRSNRAFALLFIDLDDFKRVNDSKGHLTGDSVLIAVAERLKELTRAGDTVARLSGDEFVVLVADIAGTRNALEIAARVQCEFKRPFQVDDDLITVSPSIGVSVHDPRRPVPMDVLREADAAMYEAKRAGRGHIRVYDAGLRAPALTKLG